MVRELFNETAKILYYKINSHYIMRDSVDIYLRFSQRNNKIFNADIEYILSIETIDEVNL